MAPAETALLGVITVLACLDGSRLCLAAGLGFFVPRLHFGRHFHRPQELAGRELERIVYGQRCETGPGLARGKQHSSAHGEDGDKDCDEGQLSPPPCRGAPRIRW